MQIEIPDSMEIIIQDDKCIKVWSYYLAPEELKKLSTHGGDEDWIAFIPYSVYDKDAWIGWMEEGSSFACFSVSKYCVGNGEVRIGAH